MAFNRRIFADLDTETPTLVCITDVSAVRQVGSRNAEVLVCGEWIATGYASVSNVMRAMQAAVERDG